jgi:hypothetical protein
MRRSLFTSNDRMCGPPEFDLVPTHPKAGCVGAPYSPSPSGSARFLAAAARALGACLYVGSRRRGYSTAAPFKGCSMVKIDRMDNVLKDHRHPRLAPRKYIDGFRFPFSTFRVQRQRHHDFGFGDALERIVAVHSHTSKNGMCVGHPSSFHVLSYYFHDPARPATGCVGAPLFRLSPRHIQDSGFLRFVEGDGRASSTGTASQRRAHVGIRIERFGLTAQQTPDKIAQLADRVSNHSNPRVREKTLRARIQEQRSIAAFGQ